MRVAGVAIAVIVIAGISVGSCRFLAERPARPVPTGPVRLAYATEEVPGQPTDQPIATATVVAGGSMGDPEQVDTFSPAATPEDPLSAPSAASLPDEPSADVASDEEPPAAPIVAAVPVVAVQPIGAFTSPGIGSPKAMGMEQKTLDYLNWARAQQGIQPYRMNPEMQELAREQALLYVQTRESTGQYPPADKITAATRAHRWFFREGGGPAPFEWLPFSFDEIAGNPDRNMSSLPFYRNPKGTDIGIGFAFYSGQGIVGEAGRTVRVVVWNGEWDR